MPIYQITLFYSGIKTHRKSIEAVHEEIRRAAGSNFRVLSAGEQVCAIAFQTDVSQADLKLRFQGTGKEDFHYLLAELSEVVAGYMTEDSWRWLGQRLYQKR